MSSVGIDDVTGHLNTLKQEEIELKLKDEQIKKYEDLLLTYKSTRFDDCFLIYSYDEGQENVDIITENFMEFTELTYDHHYLLIVKKKINRNVAIYLMAFENDGQLESTIDAIDLLIESKREQQEKDPNRVPSSREIRIMNKIIEKKVDEYEKKIKELIKEYDKKTSDLEQQIEEQTKKIEEYDKQLDKIAKEKNEQERKGEDHERLEKKQHHQLQEYAKKTEDFVRQIKDQVIQIENYKKQLENMTEEKEEQKKLIHQMLQKMDTNEHNSTKEKKRLQAKVEECEKIIKEQENQHRAYVKRTKGLERQIGEQTNKIEEYEKQLKKMTKEKQKQMCKQTLEPISANPGLKRFLNDKKFEMIKNSTVVLDELGNRLFKREEGDNDEWEPPLQQIDSLEHRRKEVFDFIEFTCINWNTPRSGTDILKKIYNWFFRNWPQFLYNPSEEENETTRKVFLNEFKLENTIGTIHFLPIQFENEYRIVRWTLNSSQQDAYSHLYKLLKGLSTWTEISQFATEMEVNDEQSDTFIHTSNKDVFVENEKVVTWIRNNFNLEQQNNFYRGYIINIPSLYNFFVNLYDPSSFR